MMCIFGFIKANSTNISKSYVFANLLSHFDLMSYSNFQDIIKDYPIIIIEFKVSN